MLSSLISSGTRRKILTQFLSHSDEKYYVRQLAVILGVSVGTIHRELIRLQGSGILNSDNVGNLRFFRVNKASPVFKELKQIIFKTEGVQGRLKAELKNLKGLKTTFIYGSFAKGEENAHSDVDLFLLGDISEDELIQKISDLEGEFDREINFTIYTTSDFKKEMKRGSSFLKDVIKNPKIFLVGGMDVLNGL
ncbi:MAG: nucleotidyltransferase domain-containing protein [Candidatus Omnitrophica bacterium]|nr:nucleotidyltransferase domain-containing protein [Candidatus Omnitrophota bacterium]MDO9572611.1 nucleotidyltransferase domain-containing protein [Candidatus Omnitrophota bacterium]